MDAPLWSRAPAPAGYAELCGADPACLHPVTISRASVASPGFDWRAAFEETKGRPLLLIDRPEPIADEETALIALASRVNRDVNARIRAGSPPQEPDVHWRLPLEDGTRVGDCKAVALEKRRMLALAGLPTSRIALAVVMTPRSQAHAVLLVASAKGELVLDSLSPWLTPWSATGYRMIERQSYRAPGVWLQPAPAPAAGDA